jgi:alkanesulfonate monooxygenase SsuD/methylene tetrahydromethanopterin reductase-like flavin-dependent oxidoreductase (luciferase family)
MPRPFRFGVQCAVAGSRAEWREKAQPVESLGFHVLLVPDQLGEQLAPLLALLSAAEATSSLRDCSDPALRS